VNEWMGAFFTLAGILGFLGYVAVTWLAVRFGWMRRTDEVGAIGCGWLVACAALILTGWLVSMQPRPTPVDVEPTRCATCGE
jgi:hypothetical protein